MSPYFTSALIGGAIMFALQFSGLGLADDPDDAPARPLASSIAGR